MRMWSLGMAIGLRLKLGAVILLAPFVTLFPGYIPKFHPGIHYKIK